MGTLIRGTRIVAQALLAIPDAPPACFAHWARQASVPLTLQRCVHARSAEESKNSCLKQPRSEEGSLRDNVPQAGFGACGPNVPCSPNVSQEVLHDDNRNAPPV